MANVGETRRVEESNTAVKVDKKKSSLLLFRQTLLSLSALIGTLSIGATIGYSAVLLPQLKAYNEKNDTSCSLQEISSTSASLCTEEYENVAKNRITVNSVEEESWIAASATILMAPGCWLSGISMEKLGRKKTQLIIIPTYIIAWLTIGFAPDFSFLLTGRVLSGLCVGLLSPLNPVYIAETSEPRLRGFLLSSISLALALGILISHVTGTWLSWRVTAHLSSVLPSLCLIPTLLSPESPVWLVKKNRIPEATEAWTYLRGEEASLEFEALKSKGVEENREDHRTDSWKSASFLKPLIILNVFFLTAQLSGFNAVTFYCVEMIAELSGPSGIKIAPYATLILDAIRVLASVIVCLLSRRYPRRFLALISGCGTALSLFILAISLIYELAKPWLPASLLIVYIFATGIGFVPLPWMLCGELFPTAFRGLGSGLSSGFAFICFFIVVKTGPAMFNGFGNSGTFFFYGSATIIGTVFIYFFLPETKDRTLKEIEENFKRKSKVNDNRDEQKNPTV